MQFRRKGTKKIGHMQDSHAQSYKKNGAKLNLAPFDLAY
jgi:hypothetical protein